jgi:hypothetical protein
MFKSLVFLVFKFYNENVIIIKVVDFSNFSTSSNFATFTSINNFNKKKTQIYYFINTFSYLRKIRKLNTDTKFHSFNFLTF